VALRALYEIEIGKQTPEDAVQHCLGDVELDEDAEQFAYDLVRGVSLHKAEIDRRIEALSHEWALDRQACVDRNVLRLAAYELMFCPGIPTAATINEAVELVKKYSTRDSGRFVNGVLGALADGLAKTSIVGTSQTPSDPSTGTEDVIGSADGTHSTNGGQRVSAVVMDGAALAKQELETAKLRIERLRAAGMQPRLDIVLVGDDPASITYVKMKKKRAEYVGITAVLHHMPEAVTQEQVEDTVRFLNQDRNVHGILVQHPLPKHIRERPVLAVLDPAKDVDGITPFSLGALVSKTDGFRCATPAGIMRLLEHYEVPLHGKHAVICGRSFILGRPMALMMLTANATVTICHKYSTNVQELTRQGDIVVCGTGKSEMFRADWFKEGATVIDAGYSRPPGSDRDVGDVAFEEVKEKVSFITPVPGGVGPMTVAMLLQNVALSCERRLHQ
jgi:methylenetetrahydrofolate dehydrogenase (NADP+)/methenyltetrahydrofolate cyclohydrolase